MVSTTKRLVLAVLGVLLVGVKANAASEGSGDQASIWDVLNMTQGVTGVSQEIYGLHMLIFWICVVIGILTFGVMFYSMYAHRKSTGREPATFHESTAVELVWTIIPALILIAMAFPATTALTNLYDTSEADLDIKVTGYQWKWQYEYLGEGVEFMSQLSTTQAAIYGQEGKSEFYLEEVDNPLVLPAGKKVRFLITANDVIHSWWVPELAVKKDAIPGFVTETWARVDQPGIYRGRCAELCGKDHAFMPVVVNVVEQAEYDTWLAEKKTEAENIRAMASQEFSFDELMSKGEEVYNRSCASCHGITGEGIPGAFPGLKGSPVALGPATAHIDSVVNGVSGTAMQAFGGQLSEADLAAVITYERNAWGNQPAAENIVQPVDIVKFKQGQ